MGHNYFLCIKDSNGHKPSQEAILLCMVLHV